MLLIILAMQILNVGLFAQEFPQNSISSNNLNIINSVTEYIAEVILEKTDAFPENQNSNHTKHSKNSNSFLFKIQQFNLFSLDHKSYVSNFKSSSLKIQYCKTSALQYSSVCFDITPPPPKM